MAAILGGFGASVAWAVGALCVARASRAIGPLQTLAWVMAFGLAMLAPLLALSHLPHVDTETVVWLAVSGLANVAGLIMVYRALSLGKVGIVAPIVSAEGAVTATLAMVGGQGVDAVRTIALGAVVAGVVLVARRADDADDDAPAQADARRAALWAGIAALTFGTGLYATARAAADVPVVWAVLPPRLIGVVVITLPLAVRGRLTLPHALRGVLVLAAFCEVAGFIAYAWGASHSIPIAAVLAATTGAVAAALAWLIHTERLTRIQIAGVALLTTAVAVLSALTA